MKKVLVSLMLLLSVASVGAYNTVEGSKLFNNTFLTLGVGTDIWMKKPDTLQRIQPMVTLQWGKYFTPIIGAEIEGGLAFMGNNDNTLSHTYLGVNSLVNFMNLFGNYKGYPRRAELVMYNGIGWRHNLDNESDNKENHWGIKHGMQLNFNLGEKRAWQINLRGGVQYLIAGHHFEGNCYPARYRAERGFGEVNLGVTYKFQYKDKSGNKTNNFVLANDPTACLEEVARLRNRVSELENRKPEVIEKIVEKPVEKIVYRDNGNNVVNDLKEKGQAYFSPKFEHKSSVIAADSKDQLRILAEAMKATDLTYVLTGYASMEGTTEFNMEISKKRAEAVKAYLVECGVPANRIETVAGGPTDQFGPNYEDNRIVVTTHKK